ncbi:BlaI/MecI/CopY family transcriptional regulator [Lacrimispora saccharolytica]|nr:BlaI/MecI/CopY family transcriptional regulator [Lacrimispora saccharolytica]
MSTFTLKCKLTKRDVEILSILWNSNHSMTASEISEASPGLSVNTVQAVLRKLLKNKLIEIENIVYSGTVLARSYIPLITAQDYALAKLAMDYQKFEKQISKGAVLVTLLDLENDPQKNSEEAQELEKILEEYKKRKNIE